MKQKNYFMFLITLSVILFSCKTESQTSNVINIKKAQGVRHYSNLYALPKTVIRVNVHFTQIIEKEGPYGQYAKRLLGIDQVISKDQIQWSIDKIDFTSHAIPDTNHIYLIEPGNGINNLGLSLTACGFINSVNSVYQEKTHVLKNNHYSGTINYNPDEEELNRTDMLNFNDVPLLKTIQIKKTDYEKAQALADKIFTLREDRAAIIIGDGYTEAMPEGLALKEIVNNINALETKYLSMFTGKKLERKFIYSFDFIPVSPKKITQAILFRFSTYKGVVSFNDVSGSPVIIEINSFQNIDQIVKFNKKQEHLKRVAEINEKQNGLYYRIPEMSVVKLIINEKVIAEKKMMLAQFGEVHPLNHKYLNGSYQIEFYPEYGAIKRITKIKP